MAGWFFYCIDTRPLARTEMKAAIGWIENNKWHNLNKPAYRVWDKDVNLIKELWSINGIDRTDEIKKFIKQYPLPENEVLFKLTFG